MRGFQHCGLFPLANVVADNEFEKSKIFSENAQKETTNMQSDDSCVLRIVAQSPKKQSNPYHTRPHVACLSTKRKENLSAVQDSSPIAHSKSKTDAKACSSKKQKLNNFKNDCLCCVCSSKYSVSGCEWFQCVSCNEWACENCFGLNTCANC